MVVLYVTINKYKNERMELVMNKEIMRKEDILNSDNVGSAMFNLNEVMDDMKGLKAILEPLSDPDARELTSETFMPHIVRSLESFINDINDVHNYLDQICLNSVKRSDAGTEDMPLKDFAASICDEHCEKVKKAQNQQELDSFCQECPLTSKLEGRC